MVGKTYFDVRRELNPNVGLPRDFIDGEVITEEHRDLLAIAATRPLIENDKIPIPAITDRENYYDSRHLEYWLSGLADAQKLLDWMPRRDGISRYLDFGGATGRVARHMIRQPSLEVWLCDINVNWVSWVDRHLVPPVLAWQNRITPYLPIVDSYFDLISAFSVFTHLDQDEVSWLLELRRIVRPGGYIYVTVLDDIVWQRLKDPAWHWLLKSLSRNCHDDTLPALCQRPLTERVVLEYSSAEAYNSNVFLPRAYLESKWGPFFDSIEFQDNGHNYQTVVILRCG